LNEKIGKILGIQMVLCLTPIVKKMEKNLSFGLQ